MEVVSGSGAGEDPNPEVGELFRHYNWLYFGGALDDFAVQWSSPRMTSSAGACTFGKDGNVIILSEPMLKCRSIADLKNTLLHEMIHAVLYVKEEKKDHRSHGPRFRAWMDAINSCSIIDQQRPSGGYNITIHHDFQQEVASVNGLQWKCESCGDLLVRYLNHGPPSNACCIENVGNDKTCGNVLCHWHTHKMSCGGNYARISDPLGSLGLKRVTKDAQNHPGSTSKKSKSHGARQESESAGWQEKSPVRKTNAVGKLLSLVGGNSAKSLGGGSSKEGKRRKPEDVQLNTTALPADPRKQKQEVLVSNQKTRKSVEHMEWSVASAWLTYYESVGCDESDETLTNKRTERRKREKYLLTYSRTRVRATKGSTFSTARSSDSKSNAMVCCKNDWAQVTLDRLPEHCQPPALQLDSAIADTANHDGLVYSNEITDLTVISDDD